MADKIKGITVQIGGDTAPLSKALRGVDKEIRNTQTNLKEVNKLLKLDPSSTTLLKEKQKLLADQIAKTKDKLDALKKAQEEAKQMLANGEIGQKEYEELAKQVEQCEKALDALEKEAEDTSKQTKLSAEKVGQAFQDAGEKIEAAGKKLAPFSAAAAAGLGAAVKTTADFDQSMSEVAAISGATGEDFEALRKKAREMGATTKFSASEAAEGMTYMSMAGWKTEDMLDGLDGVLSLAAASGTDLGRTSDIVTDTLTALGLSAKDAGRLADVMAAASGNANTNVEMMGETFKYAASVAGSYGYSMEDVALATGLMGNAGIKSSQAGTALRSIMSRLATDAGASSKKLGALGTLTEKLGVAFYETDGTMRPFGKVIEETRKKWALLTKEEQANYANTIAGKNGMTGWMALMNASSDDFNKLSKAINNSTGTAKAMSDTMQDNLAGQLTILKSQIQELAISIGDALMPTIRKIVEKVQQAVDWFNSLSEETKEVIAWVGVAVAALSPLLIVGGKVIKGIGSIVSGIPEIKDGLSKLISPTNLTVAAIGLLVTAIANWNSGLDDWYKRHSELTEEQKKLKEKVDAEAEAWEGLKTSRNEAYKDIKAQTDLERELWEALKGIVDETGKVVEGKEDEANILISQLNEALGTELEMVNGQIEGYKELAANIETVLQKKEAEALLRADEEAYTTARKNRAEAERTVAEAQAQVVDQEEKVKAAEEKLAKAMDESSRAARSYADDKGASALATQDWEEAIEYARVELEAEKAQLEEVKKTQETAQQTLDNYNATITNHGNLMKAVATGDVEQMRTAERALLNDFLTAESGSKEALQRQTQNLTAEYQKQLDIVKKTGSAEAKAAADNTKKLVLDSITELNKLDPKLASEMAKNLKTIKAQSSSWSTAGSKNASSYKSGVSGGLQGIAAMIKQKMNMTGSAYTWGKDLAASYAKGITSKTDAVKKAASGAAKQVHAVLHFSEPDEGPLSDFHTYGPDMMKMLAEGIQSSEWQVFQAAQGVASGIKQSLENTTVTARLDQSSVPLGNGITLNIANFNNYSDSDIRELTNEIMTTAASFAARKGAVFA